MALQYKALCYMENDAPMTIFDLLFIAVFFGAAISLVVAAYSALRGRRPRAIAILRWLGVYLGAYFGVLILVSLASPRRVVRVGENQCWDDWCIAVTDVRRQPARHHRSGMFDILKMGHAERDDSQTIECSRDAQTLVASGEIKALPVPVSGEPNVQNPSRCQYHPGFAE